MTILSGKVMAEGGSCGIATYEGDLTLSGGEVTATATGSYFRAASESSLAYGCYVEGNCTISGGKVTATGHAASSYSTTTCGIFVVGDDGFTVSGGELTATATGEYGNRFGIDSFCGAVIKGGTITATGYYAGIFTHSRDDGDIIIEGGTVTATSVDEDGYGIYARTNIIRGGTISATAAEDGGYGVYVKFGNVAISGGTVTTTGKAAGFCSEEGDVVVVPQEGQQIAMTAGADKDTATAVDGSPFQEETDISDLLSGMKYARSTSSADELSFTDVATDS